MSTIASGGSTRAESVRNGMNAVDGRTHIVVVHDGARPLVSCDEITLTIEAAKQRGAACLVRKVTDTVKEVADGQIVGTVDRSNLRHALTPQAFRKEIIDEALSERNFDPSATDECFLVEKLGRSIAFVEGSSRNIKVTLSDDLTVAEALLKSTV